jgi:hypothetical protein
MVLSACFYTFSSSLLEIEYEYQNPVRPSLPTSLLKAFTSSSPARAASVGWARTRASDSRPPPSRHLLYFTSSSMPRGNQLGLLWGKTHLPTPPTPYPFLQSLPFSRPWLLPQETFSPALFFPNPHKAQRQSPHGVPAIGHIVGEIMDIYEWLKGLW